MLNRTTIIFFSCKVGNSLVIFSSFYKLNKFLVKLRIKKKNQSIESHYYLKHAYTFVLHISELRNKMHEEQESL